MKRIALSCDVICCRSIEDSFDSLFSFHKPSGTTFLRIFGGPVDHEQHEVSDATRDQVAGIARDFQELREAISSEATRWEDAISPSFWKLLEWLAENGETGGWSVIIFGNDGDLVRRITSSTKKKFLLSSPKFVFSDEPIPAGESRIRIGGLVLESPPSASSFSGDSLVLRPGYSALERFFNSDCLIEDLKLRLGKIKPPFVRLATLDENNRARSGHIRVWGEGKEVGAYITEEHTLGRTAFSHKTELVAWALATDMVGGQVLSTCETYRHSSTFEGKRGHTFVIASVFTPEENRGKGFATELITKLVEVWFSLPFHFRRSLSDQGKKGDQEKRPARTGRRSVL